MAKNEKQWSSATPPDFGEDSPILDFYTQTFKKWQ